MKLKLLLYCCKEKPYLYKTDDTMIEKMDGDYHIQLNKAVLNENCLNGKIVAECDYEVSIHNWYNEYNLFEKLYYQENMLFNNENSCMSSRELVSYLGNSNLKKDFYAIHLKNLNVFDEPKYLRDYNNKQGYRIHLSPQNMCYAYDNIQLTNKFIIISIKPEGLCKILNKEKTIEIRKKVLKEML